MFNQNSCGCGCKIFFCFVYNGNFAVDLILALILCAFIIGNNSMHAALNLAAGENVAVFVIFFKSFAFFLIKARKIRNGIQKSITYPLIMTVMMIAVILVLIAKVLPVFSQIYAELGSDLTGFARMLMHISNLINRYMIVFVIAFVILFVIGLMLYQTDLGRVLFQGKKFAMTIAASRFANCMYLALVSGLDTDRGLELAEALVNNPHMQMRIQICKDHMKNGESFDHALLQSGVFSQIYASWIAIGYKTGDMDAVMQRISLAYEKDSDDQLNRMISALEPTLVIILCVFIGLILISLLLPLLGIMSSIG